jgi:hypothetical protein
MPATLVFLIYSRRFVSTASRPHAFPRVASYSIEVKVLGRARGLPRQAAARVPFRKPRLYRGLASLAAVAMSAATAFGCDT